MKKAVKRTLKILTGVSAGLAFVLLLAGGLLNAPFMHNLIARKVASSLSDYMECEVSVGKADITLSKRSIRLYNFTIRDRRDSISVYARQGFAVIRAVNAKTIALRSALLVDPGIYVTKYEGDSMSDFLRVVKKIAARPKKDTSLRKSFEMDVFRIENATFFFDNQYYDPKNNGCIDYRHARIREGNARGRNFYTRLKLVRADVDHLDCKADPGIELQDFSTHIVVDKGELHFENAVVKTPNSEARLSISFTAENWKKYKRFIDSVRLKAEVSPSQVSASDLRYFVAATGKTKAKVQVEGRVKGVVSDLDLSNLNLRYGGGSNLDADIHLTGIPSDIHGNLNVRTLHVNRRDAESFVLPSGVNIKIPKALDALETLSLKGTFKGGSEKFVSNFSVHTNIGDIFLENTAVDTMVGPAVMVGRLAASGIRLDKFLGNDSIFGAADADFGFYLSGRNRSRVVCQVEGKIDNLEIADRKLTPVEINLHLQKQYYRGRVECRHPDCDFSLYGVLDNRSALSKSNLNLQVNNLNLQPLCLMGDTGSFTVQTRYKGNHTGNRLDSLTGRGELNQTRISRLGQRYYLPNMVLTLDNLPNGDRKAEIESNLVDFKMKGDWRFKDMKNFFAGLIARHVPALVDTQRISAPVSPDFKGSLVLKEADSLLMVLAPEVYMPIGMTAGWEYNRASSEAELKVDIPYLQYKKTACVNTDIRFSSRPAQCLLRSSVERLYLDEGVSLSSIEIGLEGNGHNLLEAVVGWGQKDTSVISATLGFYPEKHCKVELNPCRILLGKAWWRNYPGGCFYYASDSLVFHRIGIESEVLHSGVSLDGELSHRAQSVLKLDFKDFDLGYLHYFLQKTRMDIGGQIDGYAQIHDFYEAFSFDADLRVDSLDINQKHYGKLLLGSRFSRRDAVNLELRLHAPGPAFRQTLYMNGTYYPQQHDRLSFEGRAAQLPADFLKNILASVANKMEGTVNGPVRLGGTLRQPELYAYLESDNLAASIGMLNTRYAFTHFGMVVTSREMTFKDCRFEDVLYKSTGALTGGLTHRNFKNVALDVGVELDKTLALSSTRSRDWPFWGTVFGSGRLSIKGPVHDIKMQLDVTVDENSDIHFDFTNTGNGGETKYIRFAGKKTETDSLQMSFEKFYARTRKAARSQNRLGLDFNLNVTPGLAVSLGLKNPVMNGDLKATGSGLLRVLMENGSLRLFGTYTIDQGEFDFSMADVINKRFILEDGGTISWVGPPADARINIRADYHTKAGLYPVLASFNPSEEEARQYKQKANVNSVIILSGNLMSPDIGFDIDLLNTDEDTKDKFFAVVKKDDDDEMLRQTFSLLMFNSFMAVGGGTTGLGNTALSSSSDFVFSQFNNFLSQFTDKFNIGLNYRPKDEMNNSEFQVSMSGQLFNDRLIINGNLGVSDQNAVATGGRTSNVVGEVDVEWKLTEELRLKGFNHSNDQDLTKPINTYTQGVGIVFKRDFDNGREFLYGTKPRKTKAERKAERDRKRAVREAKRRLTTE